MTGVLFTLLQVSKSSQWLLNYDFTDRKPKYKAGSFQQSSCFRKSSIYMLLTAHEKLDFVALHWRYINECFGISQSPWWRSRSKLLGSPRASWPRRWMSFSRLRNATSAVPIQTVSCVTILSRRSYFCSVERTCDQLRCSLQPLKPIKVNKPPQNLPRWRLSGKWRDSRMYFKCEFNAQ